MPHSPREVSRLSQLVVSIGAIALLAATLAPGAYAQGADEGKGKVDPNLQREQYEWSNIWWDCANDPKLPRILLIGDSISCGYSSVVTKLLEGKYHVDRLGTSRAINDPVLVVETKMMLADSKYVAIHFNNGLHGFHLPGPAYAEALRGYVALLKENCGGARLVWGSSTPVTKNGDPATLAENNDVVTARNKLAAEIMKQAGIPEDDLYQAVVGKADLRSPDGYHYNGAGYDVLGKAVTDAVLNAIR